jgi:hypothetical protein
VIGRQPAGTWVLSLNHGDATEDAAIRDRFKDGRIEDILLVVSYGGETPAWPG